MKEKLTRLAAAWVVWLSLATAALAQTPADTALICRDRPTLLRKLVALPCGIQSADSLPVMLAKIERFLDAYQPNPAYPDDPYAKESVRQALISVKKGGYGIGAVIIGPSGQILHGAHNAQLTKLRSDLHAEMNLLNEFEEDSAFAQYRHKYVYRPGLTVFSSTEPCPMCFIRLATVGVNTKYCAPGPDDGMVNRVGCLPLYWRELAAKNQISHGQSAPV
ncbi:MAG: nucleoside deaminase, partial [Bernardetiaceae bacterium]|nr:nucleoside deaminase [Bernardetiaceae bacterium]